MSERTLAHLAASPGWADLAGLDHATTAEIVDQAARFADDVIIPLGRRADAEGCRLQEGRVRTRRSLHAAVAAHRATVIATRHPAERRQGGDPAAPPVPIV
jgi:acyl-CoA dehydrogenase